MPAGFFARLGQPLMLLLLLQCVFALSATTTPTSKKCKRPIVRKEWRTLNRWEQMEYLTAVKCFMSKPGITPKEDAPAAVSRYDDLIVTHIHQTFDIHYVGHFLPWHRWFTALYEQGLREECGYRGAQPYWDWTLDVTPASKFTKSPVFHPVFGFGGNGPYVPTNNTGMDVPGRTGGGCVQDGPFEDMVVRLGPLDDLAGSPQCLKRDFSPYFAGRYLGLNQTKLTLAQPDYGWFDTVVEGGPSFDASGNHGGGHYSVGGTLGQMGDLYASPSDPLFFLHHANLDRVWWSWQTRDLPKRLKDISGPIHLMDYTNAQGGNVTLDFEMTMGVNARNITVEDTMNIMGDTFCFTYDKLY